jgi:hypothetical protein
MEGFQALRGMNGPQRFNIHRFVVLGPVVVQVPMSRVLFADVATAGGCRLRIHVSTSLTCPSIHRATFFSAVSSPLLEKDLKDLVSAFPMHHQLATESVLTPFEICCRLQLTSQKSAQAFRRLLADFFYLVLRVLDVHEKEEKRSQHQSGVRVMIYAYESCVEINRIVCIKAHRDYI